MHCRLFTLILCAVAFLHPVSAGADGKLSAAEAEAGIPGLDALIRKSLAAKPLPGLAVAVVKDGKLLAARGWGFADIESKVPVTPDTVFRIASVGKQFLAAGMLLLAEDGKLRLDDPLPRHLEDAPAAWKDITIRHILSHTGGLVRESPAYVSFLRVDDIRIIRAAYPLPLEFAPGEKYQYSNVGYFTAAEIMSRASGKPWPDFMTERVFKPAGLHATCTTDRQPRGPRARGYVGDPSKWKPITDAVAVRPSGAFFSTVLDLARWDTLMDSDTILKPASRADWWKPVPLNNGKSAGYALGWTVGQWHRHPVVRHNGAQNGFRTAYLRFPEDKFTVIVLANHNDANPDGIAEAVASLLLKEPAKQ